MLGWFKFLMIGEKKTSACDLSADELAFCFILSYVRAMFLHPLQFQRTRSFNYHHPVKPTAQHVQLQPLRLPDSPRPGPSMLLKLDESRTA